MTINILNKKTIEANKGIKLDNLLLQDSPENLKNNFYQLKILKDVATLLKINNNHLIYELYLRNDSPSYHSFEISKKSGGVRQISTPIYPLKLIQKKLNQVLQAVYDIKPSVHGFVEGKNIVTNAKIHGNKHYILNLDLKDFFPSIHFGRVRGMFMGFPYNLPPEVATILAKICCYNNQLPQGAPTSPIISNMICAKMDSQLQRLAKECKATYTRYADDITFSTTRSKFPQNLAYFKPENEGEKLILGDRLLAIIKENGFTINEKKVRLQTKYQHQEVTGLTINEFPNVKRKYVRQIRAMLHAWAKFGLENAQKEFEQKYNIKARLPEKGKPCFLQVLRGKIEFIAMVKGKDDPIYLSFLNQYKNLLLPQKNNSQVIINNNQEFAPIETHTLPKNMSIIDTWFEELSETVSNQKAKDFVHSAKLLQYNSTLFQLSLNKVLKHENTEEIALLIEAIISLVSRKF